MLDGRNGINTGYDWRTPEPLTKQLFKAIDDENLEAFKQALAEGADVNVFDEEGMTPLMSTASAYITSNDQPTLEKMAKLLIQNSNIDINAQSKQPVYEERKKKDSQGRKVFQYLGREIVCQYGGCYMYCDDESLVKDGEGSPIIFTTDWGLSEGRRYIFLGEEYDTVKEKIRTSSIQKNTALHIACLIGARDIVKILLMHPDVRTDVRNFEGKSPTDCIARGFEDTIKLEFEKAQKGKQLLTALSRNMYLAKTLLNQELNPNCWKRTYNGEIETPLSLIIESCLRGIIGDNEEILTKLLKHKDLDFSQIKLIQAIEQNSRLKQIIEQAIKERLTDTISRKDLGDVKKLVEDNCFMNRSVVVAALRDASKPTESVKNYLSEKFPTSAEQPVANTNNIPAGFEEFAQELVDELEKTKAQLAETEQKLDKVVREKTSETSKISQLEKDLVQVRQEKSAQKSELIEFKRIVYGRASDTVEISQLKRDLKQVREERDRLSSENRLLRSNKNEKPSQANFSW